MAEDKPLISILCAVYNDARFIRETLESVVRQTYPHWELIVIDGASSDGTPEIAREFAEKYKNIIVRSEPDEGQWDALDKGLSLSRGEYIAMICGQDGYLNKNWLARGMEAFSAHPDVSLVWGIPFDMSEAGKLLGPHYAYASFLNDDDYPVSPKPVRTVMAKVDPKRKSALKRLGGILKKVTWHRVRMVIKSFRPAPIPQKADWFSYWLETGRAFPEGNMIVRKEVYTRLTRRFPEETMTNAALLDFCFEFNARGYLAYGLPLAASFSRSHAEGQALREHDSQLTAHYRKKVEHFREKVKNRPTFPFLGPGGTVVAEYPIHP